MSLRVSALNGIKWTTASAVVSAAIQVIQLAILTRLLPADAFGLMALAMVAIGFSQAFIDMGLSNAIIHRTKITSEQLSTLYWLNLLAGIFIFILLAIASPFISNFYQEKELTSILLLVGVSFIIQPLGQQFQVLTRKELRFDILAKIEICTRLFGLCVSTILAYVGYGVYALVYASLLTTAFSTMWYLILGYKHHRPSRHFCIKDVHDLLGFGAYQMGEKTINYLSQNIDTLLIGRLLGVEALGIYSISKQLIMRPAQIINPIVNRVTLPVMAQVQNETTKLKQIFLKSIHHLASINFPIYAVLIAFSTQITLTLFGTQWAKAATIISILSLYGAMRSIGNPVGALLMAKGRYKIGFWWNVAILTLIPLFLYLGSHWGLQGVALSLVFFSLIFFLPNWRYLVRPLCGAQFIEYHRAIAHPLLLTILATIPAYFAANIFQNTQISLLAGLLVEGALLLILYILWNKDLLISFRDMIQNKRAI